MSQPVHIGLTVLCMTTFMFAQDGMSQTTQKPKPKTPSPTRPTPKTPDTKTQPPNTQTPKTQTPNTSTSKTTAPPKVNANALSLERVLSSLDNHPKARAAQQTVLQARAKQRQARGGFDPKLKAKSFWQPLAKEYALFDVSLMQPLAFWGTDVIVGWRAGMGPVPVYKLDADSANPVGEFYAGINLPLWRNRSVDQRRTDRQLANLALKSASYERDIEVLALGQNAIKAYTAWLAAGWLLDLENKRLALLDDRFKAFTQRLKEGDLAKIDRLDVQRTLETQKAQVLKAQQAFFKAQAKLSLYWRNKDGVPLMAALDQLPAATLSTGMLPAMSDTQWQDVLKRHPQWQQYHVDVQMLQTKRRLAREAIKPRLDLQPQVVQSLGQDALGFKQKQNEIAVGLVFEMYFFQNKARGKVSELTAKQRSVRLKQQQTLDMLWATIQTNRNAFGQVQKQVELLRKAWQLASQIEELERTRMTLGEGSWFLINARERKTLETYRKLIDAYQKALYYKYLLTLFTQLPKR